MMFFDQHTAWVLIPIAAILAGVLRQSLRLKERRIDAGGDDAAAHNARLEQRVRVLERIVTDKGLDSSLDVAAQIERLRDARAG